MDQGGKGMLLGGFSEFLEHCQVGTHCLYLINLSSSLKILHSLQLIFAEDYYNIRSDMTTDEMMSIAAENLQAKMSLIEEEQDQARLISPLHMLITRWVGLKKPETRPEIMKINP